MNYYFILKNTIVSFDLSLFTFISTFTVILCYLIATSLGHVKIWLPMISDCGVEKPEKYIFTFGLILSGQLLFINSYVVYMHFKNKFAIIPLVLRFISSIALIVIGLVNEKDIVLIHTIASLLFFFLRNVVYDTYYIYIKI